MTNMTKNNETSTNTSNSTQFEMDDDKQSNGRSSPALLKQRVPPSPPVNTESTSNGLRNSQEKTTPNRSSRKLPKTPVQLQNESDSKPQLQKRGSDYGRLPTKEEMQDALSKRISSETVAIPNARAKSESSINTPNKNSSWISPTNSPYQSISSFSKSKELSTAQKIQNSPAFKENAVTDLDQYFSTSSPVRDNSPKGVPQGLPFTFDEVPEDQKFFSNKTAKSDPGFQKIPKKNNKNKKSTPKNSPKTETVVNSPISEAQKAELIRSNSGGSKSLLIGRRGSIGQESKNVVSDDLLLQLEAELDIEFSDLEKRIDNLFTKLDERRNSSDQDSTFRVLYVFVPDQDSNKLMKFDLDMKEKNLIENISKHVPIQQGKNYGIFICGNKETNDQWMDPDEELSFYNLPNKAQLVFCPKNDEQYETAFEQNDENNLDYDQVVYPSPRERRGTLSVSDNESFEVKDSTFVFDYIKLVEVKELQDFRTKSKTNLVFVVRSKKKNNPEVWELCHSWQDFKELNSSLKVGLKKKNLKLPKRNTVLSCANNPAFDISEIFVPYFENLLQNEDTAKSEALAKFCGNPEPMTFEEALLEISNSSMSLSSWKKAVKVLENVDSELLSLISLQLVQALRYEPKNETALTDLLIKLALLDQTFANYFFWHAVVEKEDPDNFIIYEEVEKKFKSQMKTKQGESLLKLFTRQIDLITQISNAAKKIQNSSKNRLKKIETFQQELSPAGSLAELLNFESLACPLKPEIGLEGIIRGGVHIYKSALTPLKIPFKTSEKKIFTMIFKTGDDLRQDQLITQMITLLDKILKDEGLELNLTPYRVLATSRTEGLVEYVDSVNFSTAISENEGSIIKFFQKTNPEPESKLGFNREVLNNFINSCAGYAVITYILGIGDRHLDNIMLTKNGSLFHIDFGYILDHNPPLKFAPPVRIVQEMIDVMGGPEHKNFDQFLNKSCQVFICLRKHSNLVLNSFILMLDASLPNVERQDIPVLYNKFRLDLDDVQAAKYLTGLIMKSASAALPKLVENIHKFAQNRRT